MARGDAWWLFFPEALTAARAGQPTPQVSEPDEKRLHIYGKQCAERWGCYHRMRGVTCAHGAGETRGRAGTAETRSVPHPWDHAQCLCALPGQPLHGHLRRDDLSPRATLPHRRAGGAGHGCRTHRRAGRGDANGLKLVSGRATDRRGGYKAWIFAGYGLSTLTKPLLALASIWPVVLLARLLDRTGKGIRGTPRDTLIAASSDPATRGRAFGFHRSMDTVGAVIGPLVGVGLLAWTAQNFRLVFLLAAAPALAGVVLIGRVREPTRGRPSSAAPSVASVAFTYHSAPRAYRTFLGIGLLFALGNSSDTFLILRAHTLGLSDVSAVLAYALYNLVYAVVGWPAGALSDRLGRRGLLIAGFLFFAVVYGGMGLATGPAIVWPLFALYGFYIALTEGVSKAYITDLVPDHQRGGTLGLYAASTGLMALISSVLAGALWDRLAPAAPFYLGGVTALAAACALVVLLPRHRARDGHT